MEPTKDIEQYFKDGRAYIWKEEFSVIHAKSAAPDAFAVIRDDKEITVVIETSKAKKIESIEKESGLKLITIDIIYPSEAIGVTARIASSLADAGVSILPLAAYSRDHFLIKAEDLEKASKALEGLGLKVVKKSI